MAAVSLRNYHEDIGYTLNRVSNQYRNNSKYFEWVGLSISYPTKLVNISSFNFHLLFHHFHFLFSSNIYIYIFYYGIKLFLFILRRGLSRGGGTFNRFNFKPYQYHIIVFSTYQKHKDA